jgi:hypothetical protein
LEDYRGGQFIPTDLWEAEKDKASQALAGICQDLSEDVELLVMVAQDLGTRPAGSPAKVTIEKLDGRITAKVRRAYSESFRLGKRASGNFLSITKEESDALRKVRSDEYKFARKFLRDAYEGKGRVPYEQRAEMYGNALKEAFWLGFVLGNRDPKRRIRWVMGPTEHCKDCVHYGEAGPFTVADFISGPLSKGHLPRSGNLECVGINCKCYLKESWV